MAEPIHADRDHATWSASATERNWNCAGALALTADLPESTSEAADWGTCAHQLSEKCLRDGKQADEFIGTTEKGKKYEFEVDEEMAETAQIYVDYVRQAAVAAAEGTKNANPAKLLQIEQHFTLNSLKPPFDAGGTADAVIYTPALKLLEVVDLKGGRGVVVEVKGNPQLRTYALGAMLANRGLDVDRVKVTIVQPRAPHKSGRIRSDTFHIADLVEWTTDLMAAMQRSALAREAHSEVASRDMPMAEWVSHYLTPGDHCSKTFCKAQGLCPALKQKALDAVGIWFDDLDQPRLANIPNADDPAVLARDLDMLDLIEGWAKARRERAHGLAEAGVVIADPVSGSEYVLVAKQGREKWNDGAEAAVFDAAKAAGLPEAKYLNPGKLRTPKQVRKELGAKASLVADLSNTPSGGSNLVRSDKTTRPPIEPAVNKHFSAID